MFQQGISSVIHLFLSMIPVFLHELVKQGMSYILPYVLSKDRDKVSDSRGGFSAVKKNSGKMLFTNIKL